MSKDSEETEESGQKFNIGRVNTAPSPRRKYGSEVAASTGLVAEVEDEASSPRISPVETIEPNQFLAKLTYLRTSVGARNVVEPVLETTDSVAEPSTAFSTSSHLLGNLATPLDEPISADSHQPGASYNNTAPNSATLPQEGSTLQSTKEPTIPVTDPIELAKSLFKEDLPGFSRSMVCPIIGANDEYHKKVLAAYMEWFDFSKVSLDEAFRILCVQLMLTGETQAIDRILYQMSLRFWNCNASARLVFKSVDVVYGTLFSIVLLNTDLNTVNVGSRSNKKMPLKTFVKNTMSLFDDMILKDPKFSAMIGSTPESLRNWKRDFESMLKDIYTSVSENPIIQRTAVQYRNSTNSPASLQKPLNSAISKLSVSSVTSNSQSKSFSSTFNFLKKDQSKTFHHNNNQIVIEGVLIRKHMVGDGGERATNRRWVKLWSCIRISKEAGVELITHRLSQFAASEREFVEVELSTPTQYSETAKYPACSTGLPTSTPLSPFAVMTDKPPSTSPLQQHSGHDQPLHINIGRKYSSTTESKHQHPLLTSPLQDYKLSPSHDPDPHSLIHAFAAPHHYEAPGRTHTFSIQLGNGHVYLYQAPTEVSATAWIKTVNYWAALKSREPMRGGISSLDYGWGLLAATPESLAEVPDDKETGRKLSMDKRKVVADSIIDQKPDSKRVSGRLQKHASSDSLKIVRENSTGSLNPNQPGTTSPMMRSTHRSFKLAKWVPEVVSNRLISTKDEGEQLVCMQRQLEFVRGEISAHEELKERLDNRLSSHPQFQLVLSNWNSKCDALNHEFLKYEAYIEALQSVLEGNTITITPSVESAASNSVFSSTHHQQQQQPATSLQLSPGTNMITEKESSIFGFAASRILGTSSSVVKD